MNVPVLCNLHQAVYQAVYQAAAAIDAIEIFFPAKSFATQS